MSIPDYLKKSILNEPQNCKMILEVFLDHEYIAAQFIEDEIYEYLEEDSEDLEISELVKGSIQASTLNERVLFDLLPKLKKHVKDQVKRYYEETRKTKLDWEAFLKKRKKRFSKKNKENPQKRRKKK